ncbi:MAG: MerR family transcriptional regulator [Bacteroidia bacterium]|jgi:DNA-binding transcriptional MerR regulator|nr:MerR family transcriptional regulator [Bacteroidia bacterium]
MNKGLSIKDLENLSGVKAHTIRMWEKRHNIFDPDRTETNIRMYSNDDLKKLLNIASVLEHGMKISKVSTLTTDELNSEIESLQHENFEASKKIIINGLIVATLQCNVVKFETIYQDYASQHSLEDTIEEIIYPLLIRIGLMWTVSKLNPSQEHFASQMIRQKLFTAIDRLPMANSQERYVLYLPDNEDHEIGLLYAYYLIKKAGHMCIYLGPSVPLQDVGECCKNAEATSVLCAFTIQRPLTMYQSYTEKMESICRDQRILIHGLNKDTALQISKERFNFLFDVNDLKNLL